MIHCCNELFWALDCRPKFELNKKGGDSSCYLKSDFGAGQTDARAGAGPFRLNNSRKLLEQYVVADRHSPSVAESQDAICN